VPTLMVQDSNPTHHQWDYESVVAIDPTNNQNVYIGGVNLWQTQDGGATWHIRGGQVHGDNHALTFLSATSLQFYLGTDGGVWKGDSVGNFTNLNGGGLNTAQFYAGSIGTDGPGACGILQNQPCPQLYGGTQDNGVLSYGTAGPPTSLYPWYQQFEGDGGYTAVDYTDNSVVYGEVQNGAVKRCNRCNGQWTDAVSGLPSGDTNTCNGLCEPTSFIMPLVMSPTDHNVLYAGTNHLFRSTDGASTWSSYLPFDKNVAGEDFPMTAIAAAPSDNRVVFTGNSGGYVSGTTNGGATTIIPNEPKPGGNSAITSLAVDPTDAHVVYATVAGFAPSTSCGGHVFKSIDSGAEGTWQDMSAYSLAGSCGFPNIPVESVLVDPLEHNTVIVGTDIGVFAVDTRSTDGAGNPTYQWHAFGLLHQGIFTMAVDQLFTDAAGTNLYAATHGRGIWKLPLINGFIIVGGQEGAAAINANDGSLAWHTQSVAGACICGAAAAVAGSANYGDVVYVDANHVLHDLNATTGTERWQYTLGGAVDAAPTIGAYAYVAAEDSYLYAFNLTSGALKWRYKLSAYATSSPTAFTWAGLSPDANAVAIQTKDGNIYALQGTTGALLWRKSLGKSSAYSTSAPVVTCNNGVVPCNLIVGSASGVIYALDPATGRANWTFATGSTKPVNATAKQRVADDNVIFIGSQDGYLRKFNTATGTEVWRQFISANAQPTTANYQLTGKGAGTFPNFASTVYVGDGSTNVFTEVDANSGAIVWTHAGSGTGSWRAPKVFGDVVFAAQGGKLQAFRMYDGKLLWSVQPTVWR